MARFNSGDYLKHNSQPYWYLVAFTRRDLYYMYKYPGCINTEWNKEDIDKNCTLVGRKVKGVI